MSAAATDSKTSYFLDKLQSLSGVIPIGAFLLEHFWSNSYALVSVQKYNEVSVELQSIPWRIVVEACVIWLPILFHGFYGIYIWWMGKSNATRPSLDGQLALGAPALDRNDRAGFHLLARLSRALRRRMAARIMRI